MAAHPNDSHTSPDAGAPQRKAPLIAPSLELDAGPMTAAQPPAFAVQRDDLIAQVASFVATVGAEEEPRLKMVNYFGVPGVGKSFVASSLFHTFFRLECPIIWLDFNLAQASRRDSRRSWDEVRRQLESVAALRFIPDAVELGPEETRPLAEVAVLFRAEHLERADRAPLLLILDHLDGVSYWPWLQRVLVQPLLHQQPAVVICLSQQPLRWISRGLAERCEPAEVRPFTIGQTRALLQQLDLELLAPLVQGVTDGYPLRIFYLLQLLQWEREFTAPDRVVDLAWLRTKLSVEVFRVIAAAGVVRSFDVAIIDELLQRIGDGGEPHEQRRRLIRNRVYSEIEPYINPYRRGQPLGIAPELRYGVRDALLRQDPERYKTICEQLAAIYGRLVVRERARAREAFLEWAYFAAELLQLGALDRDAWLDQARRLLAQQPGLDLNLALALYKDGELLDKLEALQLRRPLLSQIHDQVGDRVGGETLNATEFATYRRWVLERIGQQAILTPINEQISLISLLSVIAGLGNDFAPLDLYERLKETDSLLSQRDVNAVIKGLYTSGLVTESQVPTRFTLPLSTRNLLKAPAL